MSARQYLRRIIPQRGLAGPFGGLADQEPSLPRKRGSYVTVPRRRESGPRRVSWDQPMTKNSGVSVVIPTHNRADLVGHAVESVLAQTDVTTEVIVVDDRSTDNTAEVLDKFGQRIRVIRNETNLERGASRNAGARAATYPILAFLDSDDSWEATKLRRQLPLAVRGMPSVTGASFVDADGHVFRTYVPPPNAERRVRTRPNPFLAGPSSLVLPRELFEEVAGFPEEREVQGSEDWLFFARLAARGQRVAVIPEPLVRYRVHATNSTQNRDNVARCMWAAAEWLEKEGLTRGRAARVVRGVTAGSIARQMAWVGRWTDAAGWTRTAFARGDLFTGIEAATMMVGSGLMGILRRSAGGPPTS